ncbi:substrate-binding domain-containing protein [Microbacterium sp. HD4P20]|uniref:substrate-binding domain-containing protein n=1 Tax=Microbacterium sp. HD4P20 TaxID=2864874 RepID=UPI001C63BAB7|nr:substrate-binding domain-containing protein [Microbacterium sp. HD4P20]MCP2638196.1 substrate-binding domain-containing protein [Microbacterium sp. HD4P20]
MAGQHPLPRKRHEHILRELELRGSVSAAEAAEQLGVSQVTVRRDIVELERAGKLARVHGGAIGVGAPAIPQPAKTNVGVVVPGSVSHYPQIVKGMEAASHSARTRVILATSQYREELEQRQVERLVEVGVAGVIFAPTMRDRTEEELAAWLSSIPVPVVFLERRLESTALARFDSARTDHERGADFAVEHLANLGHRAVGLAAFDRTPTAPLVRVGHGAAVARLALANAPTISLPKGGEGDGDPLDDALTRFLDACLDSGTTAALVHTDVHAARLIELASDRGIRVPDDLAVIAVDDDTARMAMVPLTSVTAPGRDLGREAMRILTERIATPDLTSAAARHITMLPHLTVRASCGARA